MFIKSGSRVTWMSNGAESGWGNRGNYIWCEEVICLIGHDDPYIFVNNKGRLRPGVFA